MTRSVWAEPFSRGVTGGWPRPARCRRPVRVAWVRRWCLFGDPISEPLPALGEVFVLAQVPGVPAEPTGAGEHSVGVRGRTGRGRTVGIGSHGNRTPGWSGG